jgi:hypothetical protein
MGRQRPTPDDEEDKSRQSLVAQALLLDTMTIYTGRNGLAAVLRIKLTEELFVPNVKVVYDTSSRTITRVACGGSLVGGTKDLNAQAG